MSVTVETTLDLKKIALSRAELFAGLDPKSIERLAAIAEWRHVSEGSAVARKGDPGNHLFVMHRGRVKVGSGAPDGREVTLNLLGPGAVFGEIAFADGGERTADLIAVEDVDILTLGRRELVRLLQSEPEIMLRIMEMLAARVRWVSEAFEDVAFLGLPARLAKRLLFLAQHFGSDTPKGRALAVKLSHKELANHMNVTRESINRLIQKWRREGIIDQERGFVILADSARLIAIARGD
jgi:CRP-like cAMP-binding protein